MSATKNKQYGTVDIVKFFCALLIVCAHYISEYTEGRISALIEYASSLYVIVVPFFFVCSGFLLFSKLQTVEDGKGGIVLNYIKRNLVMYAGWSIIYFVFKLLSWFRYGCSAREILQYILNAIFYSTYSTIWFLPALCVGVWLTWKFIENERYKFLIATAGILYLVGTLGVSYSFLIKGTFLENVLEVYNFVFVSTRNGLFNGFPFVALGAMVAKNITNIQKRSIKLDSVITVVSGCGFVLEALIIKLKFDAMNVNTLLLLIPFSYFFFSVLVRIRFDTNGITIWMRKMSTTVFLCQRIYLTAIPELFKDGIISSVLLGNPYIGLAVLLFLVLITAELILIAGKKNSLVAKLC